MQKAQVRNPSARPLAGPVARALALLLAGSLAGCSFLPNYFPWFLTPYRPDVQQGNVITNEMVEQLRPGMSRDQVKFMLGTPLLADTFHKDRWDYMYYLNPRSGSTQRRKLTIFFADNHLARYQSDAMPPESMADNLILGRKGKAPAAAKPKDAAAANPETGAETATPAAAASDAVAPVRAPSATAPEAPAEPTSGPETGVPPVRTPTPTPTPAPAPAPESGAAPVPAPAPPANP